MFKSIQNEFITADAEYIVEDIASEIIYQTRNVTEPIKRQVHHETLAIARNTPIIGDILTVKQDLDFFSRFKSKKENEKYKKEKE